MRRELTFKNFQDARQELSLLEKGEIETTGNWSYFQILTHVTKAINGSTKGVDREMTWWQRHVKGPLFYYFNLFNGKVPAGIGANSQKPVERIEGDEKTALADLRHAMEDFEKFEGKFSTHPLMGNLNKKQWMNFHIWHMANHLGNVRPKKTF